MPVITITVKDEGSDSSWDEKYDARKCVDPSAPISRKPSDRIHVRSQLAAEEWASKLVARFNNTRRTGEARRVLVAAVFDMKAQLEED